MADQKTAETQSDDDRNALLVRDRSAVRGPRTHRVNGTDYTFKPGDVLEIPHADAMRMLVNGEGGFQVSTLDGVEIELPKAGARPAVHLRADQTVAQYSELTRDALLARAKRYPGGEKFHKRTAQETIEVFLMGREGGEAAPAGPTHLEEAIETDF